MTNHFVVVPLAMLLACSSPTSSNSETTHKGETSFFVYLNNKGGWCALRSRAEFVAEVNSNLAAAFESDQGQVWISKNKATRIEEFRMDAEGEWSLLSTYQIDAYGRVATVRAVLRDGEPQSDKVYNFKVSKGTYVPKIPKYLPPNTFRAATKITSFPFSHLVELFIQDNKIDRYCDR